jgi:hypothetical protein
VRVFVKPDGDFVRITRVSFTPEEDEEEPEPPSWVPEKPKVAQILDHFQKTFTM